MARKRYSAEQIIGKLREAEILLAKGQKVGQVTRLMKKMIPNLRVVVAMM